MKKGIIKYGFRKGMYLALAGILSFSSIARAETSTTKSSDGKYDIQIESLAEVPFNSSTNRVALSTLEERLCERGLDNMISTGEKLDQKNINYPGFKEKVIAYANRAGYDTARLATLSPREAVELSTLLTAKNLRFPGTKDSIFEDIAKFQKLADETKDAELKKQYLQLVEDMGKAAETYEVSSKLDVFVSSMDCGDSDAPIQEKYVKGKEVVCRGFSRANSEVFRILKSFNPKLNNTYMTGFSSPQKEHMWNQVASVYGAENGTNKVYVTFVEPQAKEKEYMDAVDNVTNGFHLVRSEYEHSASDFLKANEAN